MNVKKIKDIITSLLFIFVFGFSVFNMASNTANNFYFNTSSAKLVILRFLIVIVTVFIVTTITYLSQKSLHFISISSSSLVVFAFSIYIIDQLTLKIGGTSIVYSGFWLGYLLTASFSMLFCLAILYQIKPYGDFFQLYKGFCYSISPIIIYIGVLVFLRQPFIMEKPTTNFIIFNGSFKMLYAVIDNFRGGVVPFFVFFGNIALFVPYGIILPYFTKEKQALTIIIGLITPFIIEGYQYIFSCGDVDIDDLLLNLFGFISGYIFYILFIKKKIKS